jgi:hypothetical protein
MGHRIKSPVVRATTFASLLADGDLCLQGAAGEGGVSDRVDARLPASVAGPGCVPHLLSCGSLTDPLRAPVLSG